MILFVCLLAKVVAVYVPHSHGGIRINSEFYFGVMLFVIFHKIDQEFNLLLVLKRNGEVT